jgi:hypothetical protein
MQDFGAGGIIMKMSAGIKKRLIRHVLREVLARRCENLIHRSGRAGQEVNCFVARLEKNGEPFLLLDSLEGNTVQARGWNGATFSIETDENVENLVDAERQWRLLYKQALCACHRY